MSTTPERSRATAFGVINESEQSGSFPIGVRADDSQRLESEKVAAELLELSPELVSLIPEPPLEARRSFAPPPRNPTPSERAELVIEDLTLSPENPYLASSLVPPPKQPFPLRRALAIGGGMLAAVAIGAAIQLNVLRGAQEKDVHAGAAGIAPSAPAALTHAVATKQPASSEVVAAPQPEPIVVAPAPVAEPVVPVATVAPKAEPAPKAELPKSAEPVVVPAAAVRIARVTPPAPPEPAAPVAEAAMPAEPVVTMPAADLPEYPTREQVTAGFESVRAALKQCAGNRVGTVEIKATIASTGRIVYALAGGDFNGSAEGSCMARAVREAQFPAFSQPRLKVSYPIAL